MNKISKMLKAKKSTRCCCDHLYLPCDHRLNQWICNRKKGHTGMHVACGCTHHLLTWYSKPGNMGKVLSSKYPDAIPGQLYPETK